MAQVDTPAFAERLLTDGNNGVVSPDADVFLAMTDPTTPDEAINMCYAVDINNLANQFPIFMGAPWMNGQHTYLHVDTPNRRSSGSIRSKRRCPPAVATRGASTSSCATVRAALSPRT